MCCHCLCLMCCKQIQPPPPDALQADPTRLRLMCGKSTSPEHRIHTALRLRRIGAARRTAHCMRCGQGPGRQKPETCTQRPTAAMAGLKSSTAPLPGPSLFPCPPDTTAPRSALYSAASASATMPPRLNPSTSGCSSSSARSSSIVEAAMPSIDSGAVEESLDRPARGLSKITTSRLAARPCSTCGKAGRAGEGVRASACESGACRWPCGWPQIQQGFHFHPPPPSCCNRFGHRFGHPTAWAIKLGTPHNGIIPPTSTSACHVQCSSPEIDPPPPNPSHRHRPVVLGAAQPVDHRQRRLAGRGIAKAVVRPVNATCGGRGRWVLITLWLAEQFSTATENECVLPSKRSVGLQGLAPLPQTCKAAVCTMPASPLLACNPSSPACTARAGPRNVTLMSGG